MAPSAPVGPADPHLLGAAVSGLGMFSRRAGRTAFLLIANELDPGERVEVLVQGRYKGENGAAALTDRRIVLANDREWKPDVEVIDVGPGLTIQGLADDRSASLTFLRGSLSAVIEGIGEKELAQRLASLARARSGG
jgi:hypothetical protein